jgi:hypothetical protein
LRPCFLERTSKSVEFDGENLYVGGKYVCSVDDGGDPRTGDTFINYLEINGEEIIKNGEFVVESTHQQTSETEDGWETVNGKTLKEAIDEIRSIDGRETDLLPGG